MFDDTHLQQQPLGFTGILGKCETKDSGSRRASGCGSAQVIAWHRHDKPRHTTLRCFWASDRRDYQALRTLSGVAPRYQTQRQISCRGHVLCCACSIAQYRLPLGARWHSARSEEPLSLCHATSAREFAWTRHPRRRRQTPCSGMRSAATTDPVWHFGQTTAP